MKPASKVTRRQGEIEEPDANPSGSSPLIGGDVSLQAVAWVLDFSKSVGFEKLVLIYIANHHNLGKQAAWPAIMTLAREAGVSISTVKRSIEALQDLGELEVVERKKEDGANLSNFYRLPIFERKRARDLEDAGRPFPENRGEFLGSPREFSENYNPVIDPVREPLKSKESLPLCQESRKAIPKPIKRSAIQRRFEKTRQNKFEVRKPPVGWDLFAVAWRENTGYFPVARWEGWDKFEELKQSVSWEQMESRIPRWVAEREGKIGAWTALDFLNECSLMLDEKEAGDIQGIVNEE